MFINKTIAFIGAGSMAEALIAGFITKKLVAPKQIIVTNHSNQERLIELERTYGVRTSSDKREVTERADLIVLAMKPAQVSEAIEAIRPYTTAKQIFISVIAGVATHKITESLGHEAPVIRTMPNTSAKVGASATGMSAGTFATEAELTLATALFEAVGTVTVVAEEKLDAVTAIAGSGPAYIYYFVEAVERVAEQIGLTKQEGKELFVQTLFGAAKRLQTTEKTAEQLYREVMSPGGTTEAGLNILNEQQFQETIISCIKRAEERAKQLGSS